MRGVCEKGELSKEVRTVLAVFVVLLGISICFGVFHVISIVGFLIAGVVGGLFLMMIGRGARLLIGTSLAIGFMMMGIVVCEGGHASYASSSLAPDVHVTKIDVTLFHTEENWTNATYGFVQIGYDENKLADPKTAQNMKNQLNGTILAGGLALAIISFFSWVVPSGTNAHSLIFSLMLFRHNSPLFTNDTTLAMKEGWMTTEMGWLSFLILFLAVIMGIIMSVRRKEKWV